MTIRIAINGYGRIGRCVLRALYELGYRKHISVAAINDIADLKACVHLTKYDSTHGRFSFPVERSGDFMLVNGDPIRLTSEAAPELLPWGSMGVDIVLDCTGALHERADIERHRQAGANRVLLAYPGPADVDFTAVYGINHRGLRPGHRIVSNASCTSNCLIPVLTVIDRAFGIERGSVTVIHSLLNDQPLLDGFHGASLRKSRSGYRSIVPVETKLDRGIARLMPRLAGRFAVSALRVPVANVSAMDITVITARDTDAEAVNDEITRASSGSLKGIMGLQYEPLVSSDYNHDPRSCVIDAGSTRVCAGRMVKLLAWFDNEWAFSIRMLDTAMALSKVEKRLLN